MTKIKRLKQFIQLLRQFNPNEPFEGVVVRHVADDPKHDEEVGCTLDYVKTNTGVKLLIEVSKDE